MITGIWCVAGSALEPAAHLEAVHVRHHDVEQHEVAFRALADRQRLAPAHRGDHVEIFRRQPRLQQLDVGRHVIDDENAGSHRCYLLRPIAEKAADGLDELADRDRLGQIGLATALADALLVALHRKRGDGDHRDGLELGIFLEPFGHFETGHFGQLNVHQDQVGPVLAREVERLDAVAGADGLVAVRLQQVVEELHVELVVLHDHDGLRHSRPSNRQPPTSVRQMR